MKRRLAVLGITALLVSLAVPGAGQTQEKYRVRLATVPMDGGMRNTVAGTGAATAVLAGAKLTVNGTFDGLLSPATTANVHRGPAMGARGSYLSHLPVAKATKGPLPGSIDLSPQMRLASQLSHI